MKQLKSKELISIFEKNRSLLNSQFRLAKHKNINLSSEQFFEYILTIVEPFVQKNGDKELELLETAVLNLYEKIVTLYSLDILGNSGKFPYFETNFIKLFDKFGHLLFLENSRILELIINFLYNVSNELGDRADTWTLTLLQLPDTIAIEELEKIALIGGWINGLATYRDSAIKYLKELQIDYARTIFNLNGDWSSEKIKEKTNLVVSNPWNSFYEKNKNDNKNSSKYILKIFDDFIGFGGHFETPPTLFKTDSGFVATDNKNSYLVYVDIFGYKLIKIDISKYSQNILDNDKNFNILASGEIVDSDTTQKLDLTFPLPISSSVSDKNTILFTLSNSYKIFVVGKRESS